MLFLCSRISSRILLYIWLSYLLRLFLAIIVPQTFLVFYNLDCFEEYFLSSYCRMSLCWNLSDVFLVNKLGLWISRGKITEVKYYFLNFISYYQHKVWLWLLGWSSVCQVSLLWSHCLFPPFHPVLIERKSLCVGYT